MPEPDFMPALFALSAKARSRGQWLWCHYQDLWFSPDAIEAEWRNGKFRWGPVNWRLRDPQERLIEAKARAMAAQEEVDRIAAAIK